MEYPTGLFPCEVPFDGGVVAIETTAPGEYFVTEGGDVWNSPSAQALSAKQPHLDLGRVRPTAVFGRVMHREAIPQQATNKYRAGDPFQPEPQIFHPKPSWESRSVCESLERPIHTGFQAGTERRTGTGLRNPACE
jgi:hypothetical protein